MKPFFSIITVSFNSKLTISKTIQSIKKQSYKNIEHLIIDGNSKDGTIDIIKENMYSKIILYIESDDGIYDAMNKGINRANGEVIIFLHSDDIFYNDNVLENIFQIFSSKPSLDILYGNISYFKGSKLIRHWKSSPFNIYKIYFGWVPPHTAFICKKIIYKKFKFNQNYRISSDFDFMIRVLKSRLFQVEYFDFDIVIMALGGVSNKLSYTFERIIEDNKIIFVNGLIPIIANITKILLKIPQFFNDKLPKRKI